MSILAKISFKFIKNSDSLHIKKNEMLNGYIIEDMIAKGGNSFIYSAFNKYNPNKSIIKEFFPQKRAFRKSNMIYPLQQKNSVTYELGLKAIKHEALVLNELSEYSQFVGLVDSFSLNGSFYLVFKYEEGETLTDFLSTTERLDEKEIESLIIFLLDALQILHSKNILHRDLKPSNIFLRSSGPPFLLDFGSSLKNAHINNSGVPCFRTHGYSPIELYNTDISQGPWTDFYSLGATLYRCITGYCPISVIERKTCVEKGLPDPLMVLAENYPSQYPKDLLRTIDWMLSIEVNERPFLITQIVNKMGLLQNE